MKVVYSNQKSGFDPDKRYRNPEYFERVESGVKEVVVVGDWPAVVAAHEAAGIPVTQEKPAKTRGKGGNKSIVDPLDKLSLEEIKAKLTEKAVTFDEEAEQATLLQLLKDNSQD